MTTEKAQETIRNKLAYFPEVTRWCIFGARKQAPWEQSERWDIAVELSAIGENEPYNAYWVLAPELASELSDSLNPDRIKLHLYSPKYSREVYREISASGISLELNRSKGTR